MARSLLFIGNGLCRDRLRKSVHDKSESDHICDENHRHWNQEAADERPFLKEAADKGTKSYSVAYLNSITTLTFNVILSINIVTLGNAII